MRYENKFIVLNAKHNKKLHWIEHNEKSNNENLDNLFTQHEGKEFKFKLEYKTRKNSSKHFSKSSMTTKERKHLSLFSTHHAYVANLFSILEETVLLLRAESNSTI